MLDGIGGRIDERHRVGPDGDDRERAVVRRETHAVNQQLAPVQRTQVAGRGIAQPDHAEQPVVGRIGDGDGVRELLGRVDAVPVADGHVRRIQWPRAWPARATLVMPVAPSISEKAKWHVGGARFHDRALHQCAWAEWSWEAGCDGDGVEAAGWVGAGADGGSVCPSASRIAAISCI
jgi:hypothetical protein